MKYTGEILTIDVEDLEWKISHTAENIWDLNRINGAAGLLTVRIPSIKVSDASSPSSFINRFTTVWTKITTGWDFPRNPVVKNLAASAGAMGSTLGQEAPHMPWDS